MPEPLTTHPFPNHMVQLVINSIPIDFPYDPYPPQIRYMSHVIDSLRSGQNALLESPTGTGKTLCLLCAALAWRTTYIAALQAHTQLPGNASAQSIANNKLFADAGLNVSGIDGSKSVASSGMALLSNLVSSNQKSSETSRSADESKQLARPRIVYASRTHTQLSQAIAELKKTEYRPAISVVASRDQLCIHDISTSMSGTKLNAMCRKITHASSKRRCRYFPSIASSKSYENRASELLTKLNSHPPMDIEELRAFGNKECTCPFFLSRHAARSDDCDVLFLPYNYLLDPFTRSSLDINWANDIIIIDEAHNLESICTDSISFDLTPSIRSACDQQLAKLIESGVRPNGLQIPSLEGLIKQGGDQGVDKVLGTENSTLLEIRIMRSMLSSLEALIENAPLDRGNDSDIQFTVLPLNKLRLEIQNSGGPTLETYELYLRMLDKAMEILVDNPKLSEDGAHVSDQEQKQQASSVSNNAIHLLQSAIRVLFESQAAGNESCFRTVISQHSSRAGLSNAANTNANTGRTLSHWCFNPAIAMRRLAELNARCFLLTSGTLAPLDSFASELGLSFPVRLENPHVVTPAQVWAGVVKSGPEIKVRGGRTISGGRLTSAYFARGDDSCVALGQAVIHIASSVPDGLLVFYPSYSSLYSCVAVWKRLGPGQDRARPSIWEHLLRIKRIVVEERDSSKISVAILAHRANVDGRVGSILLAVCRGKVSEGIDFSDEYGRAVIITGLPYPSAFDPRVVLKREYADEESRRFRVQHEKSGTIDARCSKRRSGSSERKTLSGAQWYTIQALRAVNQAIGRAIRHRFDYGAILLCDERFQSIPLQGQISKWLRPMIKVHPTFSEGNKALDNFFKEAAQSEFARETDRRRLEANKRQREAAERRRVLQQRRDEDDTNAVVLAQTAIASFLPPSKTEAQFLERMVSISDELKADKFVIPSSSTNSKECLSRSSNDSASVVMQLSSQAAKGGLFDNGFGCNLDRETFEIGNKYTSDSKSANSLKRSAAFLASRTNVTEGRTLAGCEETATKRARNTRLNAHEKRDPRQRLSRYSVSPPRQTSEKLSDRIKKLFEKRDVREFLDLFRQLLAMHSKIGEGIGPIQSLEDLQRTHQSARDKISEIVNFTRTKILAAGHGASPTAFLRELKGKIPPTFQEWYEEAINN